MRLQKRKKEAIRPVLFSMLTAFLQSKCFCLRKKLDFPKQLLFKNQLKPILKLNFLPPAQKLIFAGTLQLLRFTCWRQSTSSNLENILKKQKPEYWRLRFCVTRPFSWIKRHQSEERRV